MRHWLCGWWTGYMSWWVVLTVSATTLILFVHRTANYGPLSKQTSTVINDKLPIFGQDRQLHIPRGRITSNYSKDAVQQRRRELVQSVCDACASSQNVTSCPMHAGSTLSSESLKHLFVDDQRRAIYCVIPKVGCTNWKRLFVLASSNYTLDHNSELLVHHSNLMRHLGFRDLNDFSYEDIVYRLQHYYKFLFVRNPLERILSAYRDKFTLHNKYTASFQRRYGREIIREYRKNPSEKSLLDGSDVTFQEFVKYIISLPHRNGLFNQHWAPFYVTCRPCIISYDFIGKLETIGSDSQTVIRQLFRGEKSRLSFPNSNNKMQNTSTVFNDYYKMIPKQDLDKLIEIFLPDFKLFGYKENVTFL